MAEKTIDAYIQSKPAETQGKLQELREIISEAIPDAIEAVKWGEPAFLHPDGMILAIVGGYKNHMNLVVTPSAKEAFDDELTDYTTGKGSIQFSYDKPLPRQLIAKIAAYRAKEYAEDGVKWR